MKPLLPLLATIVLALCTGSAAAADIKERTKYFSVGGATLNELDRDLTRKGPLMSATGLRHPGATEVKFDGKVTYKQAGDICSVAHTAISLRLVKTLPKWTAPKSASPTTAIIWKTLSDDIARHEEDHAKIARSYVKRMESAIRNLRPEKTCDAMEASVNAVSARYLAEHQRAQIEFDTIEGREMNMRLKRLLQRNVAEAMAEKTAAQ